MSLRTRLTLAAGGAVFVALAIASAVVYVSVRSKLHDQIDVSLIQTAENVATKWAAATLGMTWNSPPGPPPRKDVPGRPGSASFARSPAGSFGGPSGCSFPEVRRTG